MSVAAKGKKDEPEKKPRRRIKKVAGHGGHHGGSWKVAYADFVTAMMALFLVLWLLSQADQKLKASVASYFRTAGVFDTQAGGILGGPKNVSEDPSPDATIEETMLNKVAEELKKRVSSSPELAAFKDRVKITVTEEGIAPATIEDLIDEGESDELEFKSTLRWDIKEGAVNKKLEEVILKTVAAFANSQGGTLLIGVDDQGTILGLEQDYLSLEGGNRDKFELHCRKI